jgi:hypothetical protein
MDNDQLAEWDRRAQEAQAKAAQALLRLVEVTERYDSGQARRVAGFLASSFNGATYPFDLFELRALDVALADDAMACIDALRWGKADLYKLIPDGERRIAAVLTSWGLDKA